MEATEIRKLAACEDAHWWYRERRRILDKEIRGLRPGVALDVGAAGGGNTRVLQAAGWRALALEYGPDGAEVASERGLAVIRGDAHQLPVGDRRLDLVVAFDVLEHLADDARAAAELYRVLRPGGSGLIAVPAGMDRSHTAAPANWGAGLASETRVGGESPARVLSRHVVSTSRDIVRPTRAV